MRDSDTQMGGADDRFHSTWRSVLIEARSPDARVRERAVDELVGAYWKPSYKYIRLKWRFANDRAKDLTQSFFANALEKGVFEKFDPARASFRTYLRTCLDNFVANAHEAETRLKRGGGAAMHSLDFDAAEAELAHHSANHDEAPDAVFHREWVRAVFSAAVDDLRGRCDELGKGVQFELFQRYDLQGEDRETTYDELAAEFKLPVTQVTNFLAWARREFRQCVLDRIRAVTASDDEFREEARAMLGVDPK